MFITLVIILLGILGYTALFKKQASSAVLTGWLFSLKNGNLFFVSPQTSITDLKVLTENQVKEITNLTDITPVTYQTLLTLDEARKIAVDDKEGFISEFLKNYGEEYKDITIAPTSDMVLLFTDNRKPLAWLIPVYSNGKCFSAEVIDGHDKVDMMNPSCEVSKEKAEAVLNEYLQSNGITESTKEGIFFQYAVYSPSSGVIPSSTSIPIIPPETIPPTTSH